MSTPDRDLVELLRQQVQRADELLNTVSATTGNIMDALEAALDALTRATGKAYSVDDPAVLAVARALLDTEHGAMRHHLWRVTPQGADPELTGTTFETADKAQELATSGGAVLYRRTVTYGPWRAVPGDGEAA